MTVELAFDDCGTGPPLVILHGLYGSRRNWGTIATRLAQRRRVLSVDLRNHGDSPWHDRHDYPALAADVARLIRAAGAEPAAVMGHSMGGKVAMTLALEEPRLVERLVVVDIAPVASSGHAAVAPAVLREVPLGRYAQRSDVEAALARSIASPAVRSFLLKNVAVGPAGLAWKVNLEALDRHYAAILGFPEIPPGRAYPGPVLFVVGGRSDYVGPGHRAGIERLFPAAEIEVIPDAGHWVHADAPGDFLNAVGTFLNRGGNA